MNKVTKRILAALLAVLLLCTGVFAAGAEKNNDVNILIQESEYKTLKVGNGGTAVRQMQTVLGALGYYDGKIDGNFSRVFESSVKAFQGDFGLEETGKIDYFLYTLLFDEYTYLTESGPIATPAPVKATDAPATAAPSATEDPFPVEEDGTYTDKDHVAAYLKKFGKLPSNYITKNEARKLGWNGSRSGLWDVAWGMSIGGDRFGNYEEILPTKKGRQYYECDIDFDGWKANAKRIVFSNDGLIFYTEDHYETFEEIK